MTTTSSTSSTSTTSSTTTVPELYYEYKPGYNFKKSPKNLERNGWVVPQYKDSNEGNGKAT